VIELVVFVFVVESVVLEFDKCGRNCVFKGLLRSEDGFNSGGCVTYRGSFVGDGVVVEDRHEEMWRAHVSVARREASDFVTNRGRYVFDSRVKLNPFGCGVIESLTYHAEGAVYLLPFRVTLSANPRGE
jgi:hypothetical protein